MKTLFFTSAFLLAAVACLSVEPDLRVHLLRDVVALDDPVTIGNVAVITPPDCVLQTISRHPHAAAPYVLCQPFSRLQPVVAARTSAPLELSARLLSDPAAHNLVV